jgi:hypothetical protein
MRRGERRLRASKRTIIATAFAVGAIACWLLLVNIVLTDLVSGDDTPTGVFGGLALGTVVCGTAAARSARGWALGFPLTGVLVIVALVSLGVRVHRYEDAHPCGEVGDVGRSVDPDTYREENRRFLLGLPSVSGARLARLEHREYPRCVQPERGLVAGVESTADFSLPAGSDKCDVADLVEARLRSDGWTLSSREEVVESGVTMRVTNARKGTAHADFFVGPKPRTYRMMVDHDSPYHEELLVATASYV